MTNFQETLIELKMGMDTPTHVACCMEDATYCGAPFHPEVIADVYVDEDDCCLACIDTMYLCIDTVERADGVLVQHMTCPVAGKPCADPIDEPGDGKCNPVV